MSLQTALNQVANRVNGSFIIGNLATDMATWNTTWPIIFTEGSIEQGTVRDWFVQSNAIQLAYSTPASDSDLRRTIDVVVRILEAGIVAENTGRISGAQAASLEAAFLAAW